MRARRGGLCRQAGLATVTAVVIGCAALMGLAGGCSGPPTGEEHMTVGTLPGDEPRFTVPFEMLEPYWSGWREYAVGGTLGLYMRRGEVGTIVGADTDGLDPFTTDAYGNPVAPTRDGAVIYFDTDGLACGWIERLYLVTDGRLAFQVMEGRGLVHVSGRGLCTLSDGTVSRLE